MKSPVSKKAQVYGLSTFLYAIAIAVVLVISLVGMSKDFEKKSASSLYRFNAVMSAQTGENLKKMVEQERSYIVSKSLFVTGAFGGYSITEDFSLINNCTKAEAYGCSKCSSIADYTCDTSSGACKYKSGALTPYTTLFASSKCVSVKSKIPSMGPCTVKDVNNPLIPEKKVVYWFEETSRGKNNCVPDDAEIMKSINTFAKFFAEPEKRLADAVAASTQDYPYFNYLMNVKCYPWQVGCPSDKVVVDWFSWNSGDPNQPKLTILSPVENPIVKYTFSTFITTETGTEFFKLMNDARTMASQDPKSSNGINGVMVGKNGVFPGVLDSDHISNKYLTVGQQNCSTNADKTSCGSYGCGKGTDYCQYSSDKEGSFRVLAQYASTLPKGTEDSGCVSLLSNPGALPKDFSGEFRITAGRQTDGKLLILSSDSTVSNENKTMLCIMQRLIAKANSDLKLGSNTPFVLPGSDTKWHANLSYVTIKYKQGAPLASVLYNSTTSLHCGSAGEVCCSTSTACVDVPCEAYSNTCKICGNNNQPVCRDIGGNAYCLGSNNVAGSKCSSKIV